jgi:hypothetical protein
MAIGETIVGTLWASFAGICIEKLLDELLKVNIRLFKPKLILFLKIQNGINQKKSVSKDSQDASQPPTSPTLSSTMINSSDNLLYNLSYLSSVIHPVIILRLLEHRIFTPLFKKKSVTTNQPTLLNENKNNNNSTITSNIGASALSFIPILPQSEQRNSITKSSQPNFDKNRKVSRGTPSTSISGGTTSSQLVPNNDLSSNVINPTDLSLFLSSQTTNNSNQNPMASTTTRKWFWRNSEKNIQSNLSNDRNPLLQAIVENDPIISSNSVSTTTTNNAGVGEIKLFEKELLNLPSFQLSDSQNPLLPSPTCLSYDFPTQFDQTNPIINVIINQQFTHSLSNGLHKSNIDECKSIIIFSN